MKLSELLKGTDYKILGQKQDCEVLGIKHQSEDIKNDDMFFCLKGSKQDGHDFALEATQHGASVIVSERDLNLPKDIINVVTNDTRKAMAIVSSNFYKNPSKDMQVVMVTGTNGKTTTTYLLDSICKSAGKNSAIIGTNGAIVNGKVIQTNMTTPDPIELQKLLRYMKDRGVEVVIMEMSAHALELQKNSGIMSDISIFTNLTQDHLDYFLSMKNYGEAKQKLFNSKASKFAVLNIDDNFSKEIIKTIDIPYFSTSINADADFTAMDIKSEKAGQTFKLYTDNCLHEIALNLDGRFNVSNSLGAIAAANKLGISYKNIISGLQSLKSVPGRFNSFLINGKKFIVDYAHTPDGLENILKAGRQLLRSNGKLISIFGCGGNRDKLKRPIMGQISSRLSDITIITSDNPRLENPLDIISDIENGVESGANYYIEPDRRKAIKLGFNLASQNDIIIVSGKGAEDYIDIGGVKTHYADSETIEELGRE